MATYWKQVKHELYHSARSYDQSTTSQCYRTCNNILIAMPVITITDLIIKVPLEVMALVTLYKLNNNCITIITLSAICISADDEGAD